MQKTTKECTFVAIIFNDIAMIFFWLQVLFLLSPLVCLFFTDVNTLFDNIVWYYSILVFWIWTTYTSHKEVKRSRQKFLKVAERAIDVCLDKCLEDPLYNTLTDEEAQHKYLESMCSVLSPDYIRLKTKFNEAMLSYRNNIQALFFVIVAMVIVHIILGLVYLCN